MTNNGVPEGIHAEEVAAWFAEHVPGVTLPLDFALIAGGHSNLTFTVTDVDEQRWVLRRPPLGQVLATAHDMGREHRIISALGPTDVPVPGTLGLSADDSVNGAPFYVMEYVEGTVIRHSAEAEALAEDTRQRAGESLIDVLAQIHAVDVDAVGLGDLSRKEGYIERQLKRWHGQWRKSQTRELPIVDEVFERLSDAIPEQGPATIVHGDYRLDNCLLGSDGEINAVLDWEICTLGDPLADLGLLIVYWGDPNHPQLSVPISPTALAGFLSADDLLSRYAATTGRDLTEIDFYIAFGYWKLACIVEGVYARYVGGAMGDHDRDAFSGFAQQVEMLAERGRETVGRLP